MCWDVVEDQGVYIGEPAPFDDLNLKGVGMFESPKDGEKKRKNDSYTLTTLLYLTITLGLKKIYIFLP